MLVGYARVSTHDQTLDLQLDALKKVGCEKFYTDTASGAKAEREGLEQALDYAKEGDVLVVWRLDRLGRSLRHLIEAITLLTNPAGLSLTGFWSGSWRWVCQVYSRET